MDWEILEKGKKFLFLRKIRQKMPEFAIILLRYEIFYYKHQSWANSTPVSNFTFQLFSHFRRPFWDLFFDFKTDSLQSSPKRGSRFEFPLEKIPIQLAINFILFLVFTVEIKFMVFMVKNVHIISFHLWFSFLPTCYWSLFRACSCLLVSNSIFVEFLLSSGSFV